MPHQPRLCSLVVIRRYKQQSVRAQLLRFLGLSVMLADQRLEALRKADEPHGQRAVLEHFAHFVVRAEPFRIDPDACPIRKG